MRFPLLPLPPHFYKRATLNRLVDIYRIHIYIDTEGKKEFRHANLDSKKTNIHNTPNIGGVKKSIIFVRLINSSDWRERERERKIELPNYRSKYRRSTNAERCPTIGADGKSDRWQKSDESGDWQRPISTNGRRDIYIYMYTNPGRYINYVACSIKIDLRLIGNARAHATREKPCSVSTDFQPPPRYYRGQFRNEHLANERAPWTTRIEADNRPMNANETCSNNKLSSPTILRLFSAIRSLLSYQILLIRGLEEGRRKGE